MRFLVDECTGPAAARWLERAGHDVTSVYEESPGADDSAVIEVALRENRILVTNDKGFGEKVFRQRGRRVLEAGAREQILQKALSAEQVGLLEEAQAKDSEAAIAAFYRSLDEEQESQLHAFILARGSAQQPVGAVQAAQEFRGCSSAATSPARYTSMAEECGCTRSVYTVRTRSESMGTSLSTR